MKSLIPSSRSLRRVLPAVALVVLAATPLAHAANVVVVNDLGDLITGGEAVGSRQFKAESFAATVSGQINLVQLDLNFNAAAVTDADAVGVYLYSANGTGAIGSELTELGTITATSSGATVYTVSGLTSYSLVSGSDYAIEIGETLTGAGTPKVSWEYAANGSANSGTGGSFFDPGAYNTNAGSVFGTTTWVTTGATLQQRLMAIDVTTAVPEPSTFALLIGAGSLGFVALRRRKARSA